MNMYTTLQKFGITGYIGAFHISFENSYLKTDYK